MSALGTILSLSRRANQEVSPEMRAAVIATVNAAVSQAQASRTFSFSQQAVSYIIKHFKETGYLRQHLKLDVLQVSLHELPLYPVFMIGKVAPNSSVYCQMAQSLLS